MRVQPRVNLAVAAGRIDLAVDADLTETSGPVHDVEVVFPGGFRVVRVSAEGLTDWSVSPGPAATLRLRFDGVSLHQRRVRVDGWIAVAADPFASAAVASSREVDTPWPRWVGQDEQAGTLTVSGPTRSALVRSPGATLVASEPAASNRMTYRVTRPDDLGRLRWEVEPPRVAVIVQSQLTIDPDTTEWAAVLRYDVSDGPLDAINLKLPSEWARGASVWLDGVPCRPQSETRRDPETRRESTYWSIRPDRPVWGSQRLVVRSSNPSPPGEVRSFPDVTPLGWGGAVDTSLRIANATDRPIAVEGSSGLQPVAPQATAGVGGDDELAASTLRAAAITSYHVVKSGWSLRVQRSDGPGSVAGPRVVHGEVVCTLAADGSVFGLGRYEVGARSGSFLGVELPAGSAPLWASVNGTPARPLVAGPGRRQFPLAGESASRVALAWRSDPPAPQAPTVPRPLPLPVVGRGLVPVVVRVRAGAGFEVTSAAGRLHPTGVERVELEKAGWVERETAEALSGLDRGSRRESENLVAALVRFELHLRRAERAATFDPVRGPGRRVTGPGSAASAPRADGRGAADRSARRDRDGRAAVHLGLDLDSGPGRRPGRRPPRRRCRSRSARSAGRTTFQGNCSDEPGTAAAVVWDRPEPAVGVQGGRGSRAWPFSS